jgi:tetratricopeptide (TPR) repeat protein
LGGKRIEKRERFHVYLAILIMALLCGCRTVEKLEDEDVTQGHFLRAEYYLLQRDFERSLKENEEVLALTGNSPPGDVALYNIGLIYSHFENPERNYTTAMEYFERLGTEFPKSPLVDQAKSWILIIEEIEIEKVEPTPKKIPRKETGSEKHFRRGRELLAQKDFEQALKEYQQALKLSPRRPPGDKVLFDMGVVFAHYDNPNRDYRTSLEFFQMLIAGFPQSPLFEQANVWVGVLQAIEKTKQVDIEIEEKKKELTR